MLLGSLAPKCLQWWICTSWTWWRPITVWLCEPPPFSFVTSVFYKRLLSSVFRSINKGCVKTSCLYSSTRASTLPEVLISCSWQDTGVLHGPPPLDCLSLHAELGPVHEWTPMNICCHPLRLEPECSSCWLEGVQHLGFPVKSNIGDISRGPFCLPNATFWEYLQYMVFS